MAKNTLAEAKKLAKARGFFKVERYAALRMVAAYADKTDLDPAILIDSGNTRNSVIALCAALRALPIEKAEVMRGEEKKS